MSTLTLKNLPATVDRLQAMIRAGKPVRITEDGQTVATLAPAKSSAMQRPRKTRMSAAEWLEKNPPPGPARTHLHMGEYLRKARASEG